MVLSPYFWDGFQHAVAGGVFALVFTKLSHTNYFRNVEYLFGLVMSSSALFFLPAHITRSRSIIDRLYQFVHYPLADWDILIFGIKWHRFFLTHSLLIPATLVVLFLQKPFGYRLGIGMSVGLSSHLVWDAITCSLVTPVVFVNNLIEIRGYLAKGWLLINGVLLIGFAWFVTSKIQIARKQPEKEV